ncbi:MarR family transcriptional regulator [Brachybacterium vulturis]|uniref:MarR family transcriptional regulator n=2 Tax=Brachybacterium vulturis TaxID=2017484 RepID=A0A291GSB3_9MICO|nr:MarR family transcriptional regulator [Brachybacterium vulturis]
MEHTGGDCAPGEDAAAREPRREVARLLSLLDRHRRLHRQERNLGDADLRILWLFADGSTRTLREIADALHLEQSTVNRQVNAAVTEGLLERTRGHGGQAYRFQRTATGYRLFEADVAASLAGYDEALAALGAADAATFVDLLGHFTEAYRVVAERSGKVLRRE